MWLMESVTVIARQQWNRAGQRTDGSILHDTRCKRVAQRWTTPEPQHLDPDDVCYPTEQCRSAVLTMLGH